MKNPLITRYLAAVAAVLFTCPVFAEEAENALLEAASKGDAPRIVLALSEADPNTRDAQGRTALMLAAEAGDFESVRRLLWGGAKAELKDPEGKTARDFLNREGEAFAPLSLILRCYAFVEEFGRNDGKKARIPHLAVVNDNWVDPTHPRLQRFYAINQKELEGRSGVDDDGNGFIDDVYGWNFQNDEPLRAPQLSIDQTEETQEFLKKLMDDYQAAMNGDSQLQDLLRGRYHNPLVRQIGFQTLAQADLNLNDYKYAEMLYLASHGTHVAGIITEYSEEKARVIGSAISASVPPTGRVFDHFDRVVAMATESENYPEFILALLHRYREEAITKGRRASDYLRACGAGVVNMSWTRSRHYHDGLANDLKELYRKHGKNPASIDTKPDPKLELLLSNLSLELTVADAAAFALAFYENPDVLVVIAAGNNAENNDELLPSPAYLSRFFPNVMTIASVDDEGKPSRFTNYGTRSVQLAAPGENIESSILAGMTAPMTGTSMAAPVVAGIAAGIRADFPALSAADLRRLLEASASRSQELADVVSTSGTVDPKSARMMAASWSKDNLAMLVEEVRKAAVPGRDGPVLKVAELESPTKENPSPTSKDEPSRRLTTVAGSGNEWRAVMSTGTPFEAQRHLGVGPWPSAAIEEGWGQGLRISNVAGDQDGWNVVMSGGISGQQAIFGFALDQQKIAQSMGEGFRITSVAGWKDNWIVVMDTETGYGNQRYTLPTPLTESRRQWIEERWKEGFRITAVGGDDHPEDHGDGYFFVMTENSGLTEQVFSGPTAWPEAWVEEHLSKGFAVTAVAGGGDRMLVVMSKGTSLKDQAISPAGDFPGKWIQERW